MKIRELIQTALGVGTGLLLFVGVLAVVWTFAKDRIKDGWIKYNLRLEREVQVAGIRPEPIVIVQPSPAPPSPASMPSSKPESLPASASRPSDPDEGKSAAEKFFNPIIRELDAGRVPDVLRDNLRSILAFRSREKQQEFTCALVTVGTAVTFADRVIRALAIAKESLLQRSEEFMLQRDVLCSLKPSTGFAFASITTNDFIPGTCPYKFEPYETIMGKLMSLPGVADHLAGNPEAILNGAFYVMQCGMEDGQMWVSPNQALALLNRRNASLALDFFDVGYVNDCIDWLNNTWPRVTKSLTTLAELDAALEKGESKIRPRMPLWVTALLEMSVPRPLREKMEMLELYGFAGMAHNGPNITTNIWDIMKFANNLSIDWFATSGDDATWSETVKAVNAMRGLFQGGALPKFLPLGPRHYGAAEAAQCLTHRKTWEEKVAAIFGESRAKDLGLEEEGRSGASGDKKVGPTFRELAGVPNAPAERGGAAQQRQRPPTLAEQAKQKREELQKRMQPGRK